MRGLNLRLVFGLNLRLVFGGRLFALGFLCFGFGPGVFDRLIESCNWRTVRELLANLEEERIVSPAGAAEREGFVQLGRPAQDVRVLDVLSAIRGDAALPSSTSGGEASVRAVSELIGDLERSLAQGVGAQTLAGLLEGLPRRS